MKLPELKSKFKNRYAIRIIAGVLVVTLVATGSSVYSVNAAKAGSAATENVEETEVSEEAEDTEDAESSLKDLLDNGSKVSEKEIGKEETVYVIADNTGKEQKIIVSDHLINNDDKDTLEDASTLKDIENYLGNREVVIVREITKIYEEILRGRTKELLEKLENKTIKGEIVLIIKGVNDDVDDRD